MLQQLHDAIVTNFLPALIVSDVSELESSLFFLPSRMGRLDIRDPNELCDVDFGSSLAWMIVVSVAIDGTTDFG